MSENSQLHLVDNESTKKQFHRRQGKASKQKHTDAFREKKGATPLSMIYQKASLENFGDLDLVAGLELISKLHIQKSLTEAQVPATTRAVGFTSQEMYSTALLETPRVVRSTGITPTIAYRVSLSQVAVQQSLSSKISDDLQDVNQAERQPDFVPLDVCEQVLTTSNTFGIVANVVNSFGRAKHGARSFRTFIKPHDSMTVEVPMESSEDGSRRRALPVVKILPSPYRVTIQTLRKVVVALADTETPQNVRDVFYNNNPIPGARWNNDTHVLLNPDEICPNDYLGSAQFSRDIETFNHFISGVGVKLRKYLGKCSFTGQASQNMFVSAQTVSGSRIAEDGFVSFESETSFRSQYELSDQALLVGATALVGEMDGSSFRDPTTMTSRIDFGWKGMIRTLMAKE